jgi:hypothetical protein
LLGNTGCGRDSLAAMQNQGIPAATEPRQPRPENKQAKTPLMRSLLDALDGIENLKDEDRDNMRGMLLEHDDTLHRAIGGSARDAVLRAQRRHPRLIDGPRVRSQKPRPQPSREELPSPAASTTP